MPEYLIELETSTLTTYRVKAANEAAAKKRLFFTLTISLFALCFYPCPPLRFKH